MALRVLLADNSETIRKVIQLTLQDYAADVRSVHAGVDVIDVAKQFQPDIIFADILLQKRNGYEVCQDLKADPQLSRIPVVLMWSGFMDLDGSKAQQVRADATLEKPFDSNELRNLVLKLVPKANTQTLSAFMDVPGFAKQDVPVEPPPPVAPQAPAPSIPQPPPAAAAPLPPTPPVSGPIINLPPRSPDPVPPPPQAAPPSPLPPAGANPPDPANWTMESFDDIGNFEIQEPKMDLPEFGAPGEAEDFAQVPIGQAIIPPTPVAPVPAGTVTSATPQPAAAPFSPPKTASSPAGSAGGFQLDVPDEAEFDGVTVSIVMPIEEINDMDFLLKPTPGVGHGHGHDHAAPTPPAAAPVAPAPSAPTPQPAASPAQSAKPSIASALATPAPTAAAPATLPQLSEEQLETLLKNQSQEIIEKIVWKLIPDMAERIIRAEIQRLLDEPDLKP